MAEVLGRDALGQDKIHRTYGFAQVAEQEAASASPEARTILEAYARGVNAYIMSLDPQHLPPEFQILGYRPKEWTPADSLLMIKLFFEVLSDTWQTDIMRASLQSLPAQKRQALLVETSPLDVLVVGRDVNRRSRGRTARAVASNSEVDVDALKALASMREETVRAVERLGLLDVDRAASNNWVVSGRRTATGKPLLANDPHLPPSAPSIWHMVHLSAPGMRVAGVTAPGLPGVIIGHNERIAWGFTNVGPDVSDLYLEKFDSQNPRRYLTPQGWREAEVRSEKIRVRKSFTSDDTETETLDVVVTRHGPVVFESGGKRYALRWTALDPKLTDAAGFYALNTARNWTEFQKALRRYTAPMQNMVYADVDGHIGYYAAGRVPIRKTGDGSVPYDGSTDAGRWMGFIPFEGLPHVFDPPSGIIVTANQRIVGQSYPYHLTHHWPAPYRARRIFNLLEAEPKLNAEDFLNIQADNFSIAGKLFASKTYEIISSSVARKATASGQGDGRWPPFLLLLHSWNGRVGPDSKAAPLVAEMRLAFSRRIFAAALGPELGKAYDENWYNSDTLIDRLIEKQPSDWLPKEFKSYEELLMACYEDARAVLTQRLGADDAQWTWGRYATVRFPHVLGGVPLIGQQFAIPPLPQNGSGFNLVTVNVGRGVSMRFIADPNNWDHTQHGITLGQSGLPSSPHWRDQLEDWRVVTPRRFPFTQTAVESAARQTIILSPPS